MKTIKKWLMRLLILAVLLIAAFSAFVIFVPFSDGMRAGQVMKLSHKGVIFKTYEGELNLLLMPSTNSSGMVSPNVWDFTVSDKAVAEQIMQASASGQRMELYYKERYFKFPWQGDTKYFVYKVMTAAQPPLQQPIPNPQQIQTTTPIGGVNGGQPIQVK